VTAFFVALGAAVGAPARYHVDRWLQRRTGAGFPYGTLAVNVIGSFVLGLVVAGGPGARWQALLGVGFCGAFTTYSTFGYETVRLAEDGARTTALINVGCQLALGLSAAALGWWLGSLSR
jgi:CrcB protein